MRLRVREGLAFGIWGRTCAEMLDSVRGAARTLVNDPETRARLENLRVCADDAEAALARLFEALRRALDAR